VNAYGTTKDTKDTKKLGRGERRGSVDHPPPFVFFVSFVVKPA